MDKERYISIWAPTGEEIEILQKEYDVNDFVYHYKAKFQDGSEDWIPADEVDFKTETICTETANTSAQTAKG